jgi:hypothetical protein
MMTESHSRKLERLKCLFSELPLFYSFRVSNNHRLLGKVSIFKFFKLLCACVCIGVCVFLTLKYQTVLMRNFVRQMDIVIAQRTN